MTDRERIYAEIILSILDGDVVWRATRPSVGELVIAHGDEVVIGWVIEHDEKAGAPMTCIRPVGSKKTIWLSAEIHAVRDASAPRFYEGARFRVWRYAAKAAAKATTIRRAMTGVEGRRFRVVSVDDSPRVIRVAWEAVGGAEPIRVLDIPWSPTTTMRSIRASILDL